MASVSCIAVQGCVHGQLSKIYDDIAKLDQKPDLLLILGDFQSLTSEDDYQSISIPPKYLSLGDFPEYYNGKKKAPILTVFIGGNHENMSMLNDLPYGGYIAENIYYMGYSGVILFNGIRIGGISGIYKKWDFHRRRPTHDEIDIQGWKSFTKSMYHVRQNDVFPIAMCRDMDIMMSHDWPQGVVYHGDVRGLLKRKPYFRDDIKAGRLGSPILWDLLNNIKPKWWLSAHLHVRYEATVKHSKRCHDTDSWKANTDEIELDLSLEEDDKKTHFASKHDKTRFLALDKRKHNMDHMSLLTIDTDRSHKTYCTQGAVDIYWDPEYIRSLQLIERDKVEKKYEEIIFSELIARRDLLMEKDVNWALYRIPRYTPGMERNRIQQTEEFRSIFLNN